MNENIALDENGRWGGAGVTNDSNAYILNFRMNPVLNRLICEAVVTSSNTSIGSTIPGLTEGSVLFGGVGGTLAEDNAHFFWDDTRNYLGLGINTPTATLHVNGSVRFDLGGDATGDIYFRNSSGDLEALPIGTAGQVLTVTSSLPSWESPSSVTGYDQVQDDGVPITQRHILNFVDFFTINDNAGNSSTDINLNVTELANDTTFVDDLIANTYFTTSLANDNNFVTTLTSNATFQSDLITIINNAGSSIQIDLTDQVTGVLPLANGGTQTALADPNDDRIFVWDDTDNSTVLAVIGSGLTYDHSTHTLSSTSTIGTVSNFVNIPIPSLTSAVGTHQFDTNTELRLTMFSLPFSMTVNAINIDITAVGNAGTLDLTVYTEDGQSQVIAVTTGTISGAGTNTTSVSSVVLSPGNYYFAVNPNGTADITARVYSIANLGIYQVSGNPVFSGTLAITASTPPATFTPSAITFSTAGTVQASLVD